MKHFIWLTLPALLLAASWVSPSPVTPEKPRASIGLPAYGSLLTLVPSKGGERTVAIVAPANEKVREQRLALVALYAYDPHGNCVARDEYVDRGPTPRRPASDDAAIEWFPPSTATYTVELRNQGSEPCILQMAIR